MDPERLAHDVVRRERAAIGRALSLVEDRRPSSEGGIIALLRALRGGGAGRDGVRVGLTGPPGAGKSSLVAAFARELRHRQRSVGVLAVDPTSPRTGGALLGDRSRIDADPHDDGIFVRSMASGGDLGGLARAARSAVDVLSASHDVVLIETVGVGQNETDVELVADMTVLVMQPGSGDILQLLKAGILEIPDLFVVNKIDLGDVAHKTRRELAATMPAIRGRRANGKAPSVYATSTVTQEGVTQVIDALDAIRTELAGTGELVRRRAEGEAAWAMRALTRRIGEIGVEALGGMRAAAAGLQRAMAEGAHGLEAVQRQVFAARRAMARDDAGGAR